MEQILLKAATTATDKGIFEAVISTSAPDREKDVVDPNGMVRALQKWATTGKRIPLAWNHSGDPDKQIGYVIPESAKAVGTQVVVSGHIDLDSEVGQHAWRLVKAGTLGFSFGYLILDGSKRKGGGRNITELDVFEITATPTPMNNDTRVLAFKGAKVDQVIDEALEQAEEAGVEVIQESEPLDEKQVREEAAALSREYMKRVAPDKERVDFAVLREENAERAARVEELERELAESRTHETLDEKQVREEAAVLSRELAEKDAPDKDQVELELLRKENAEKAARLEALEEELTEIKAHQALEADDDGKSVRDHAEDLSLGTAHKNVPSRAEIELVALREQNAAQVAQLKALEEELASTKQQLDEHVADSDVLRRASEALTLDAVKNVRRRDRNRKDSPESAGAEWVISEGELAGAKSGELKAVWTTAYVNDLPDSAFLYVEPGGSKDSEGKATPRGLRHFPYKDASGAVDLPHLRNALARIPQSSLSADVKDRLTSRAQNILDNQKSLVHDPDVTVDVTGRGHEPRSVDPLVQEARLLAVKFRGAGIERRKPPREEKTQTVPEFDEDELRSEMRDLMSIALRGKPSQRNGK